MQHPDRIANVFETPSDDFEESFAFEMEDGLRKTVTVSRAGLQFFVMTSYLDGAVTDTTVETFEADGPVKISVMESGIYLSSARMLLADRVRLRRTRFF
ncbi:hypothetical protein [Neorhizobium sp. NCHU2750]|uniref:hypothetical protein n=1 Tax=Neorhizobium sp. NCHU2750 TaxID=1825976 RepID=UPI000EB691AA|nr:hypothetical protein NCHU2750_05420 [Neorhizobium sp. NCHU2750]